MTETARFCVACGAELPEQDPRVALAQLLGEERPAPQRDAPSQLAAPPPGSTGAVPTSPARPERAPAPRAPVPAAPHHASPVVPMSVVVGAAVVLLAILLVLLLAA